MGFIASCFFNLFEPFFRIGQRWLGLSRIAWLFVGPNLVIFGLFTFLPIVINFHYAMTSGVQIMPSARPFVGAENFSMLFECSNHFDISTCNQDLFWKAIANTSRFTVLQVVLMVFFSLLTALVLNRKIIGRSFWRGVFFYPVLLSPVVVALLWKWILQRHGLLNAGLMAGGYEAQEWLTDANWSFFWVIFVSIWAHMGFYTLILLAGLQAIPRDVYDAAEMDAASPWRTLSRITIPLLMPNLIVVVVLALIRAIQIFDEVFVLTGGGPGSATTFIVQYIYQVGFAEQIHLYGLAAAASLVLAAGILVLTLLQLKLSRAGEAGKRKR